MIKKIGIRKVLVISVPIVIIFLFMFLRKENTSITTEGFTINAHKTRFIEMGKSYKEMNLKFSTKSSNDINFKIYDNNGKLEESGLISINNSYEKDFNNIKGKWKVELATLNDQEVFLESVITKK